MSICCIRNERRLIPVQDLKASIYRKPNKSSKKLFCYNLLQLIQYLQNKIILHCKF